MAPIRRRRNWTPQWTRRYDRRPQHFYTPRRPPQVRRFANAIRRRARDRRQRLQDEHMYRSERENEQILHHTMIQEANKQRRRQPIIIEADSDDETVDLRRPVELTEENYDEEAIADEQALTDIM